MKRQFLLPFACLCASIHAMGQVSITGTDIFVQPGSSYRAYGNSYDPMDLTGGTAYAVPGNLIGSAGPDQFWDFSKGPTDRILRYEYLVPEGLPGASEFPDAQLVEQMTDESDDSQQWLYFAQIPGTGRKVFGFYADNPFFTPSNLFTPAIVDFPDSIQFGQEWTTSTTYENSLQFNDTDPEEGGAFDVGQRTTLTSSFKVDAAGTIVLPDEIGAFAPGLRIDEEETIDVSIDFGDGQFQHVETDYVRNYYWVMPGYGLVAQLNSTQGSSPPPENFPRATSFLRMFESTKKPATGQSCVDPGAVSDLRIRVSGDTILLTWSKADCATRYVVEATSEPEDTVSWAALGDPTSNLFWQGETRAGHEMRFYRVVSLK